MSQSISQDADESHNQARTAENRIVHLRTDGDATLLEFLTNKLGLTRAVSEWLVTMGAIYVDRRRVLSDINLTAGQYVRAHLKPKRFPVSGIDWKGAVVYQDGEVMVVNKPAGVPVHATLDNQVENVLHQLQVAHQMPLYITQRLDSEVSGLMVFAKARPFQRGFNQLLVERKVQKRYCAIVTAAPEIQRYVHYMEPTARGPKTVMAEPREGWLECALRVVAVQPCPDLRLAQRAFEVEIELETGRTHQIRAQLAAVGSPIVGDSLYGSTTPFEMESGTVSGIALCSVYVAWPAPDGTQSSFSTIPWRR